MLVKIWAPSVSQKARIFFFLSHIIQDVTNPKILAINNTKLQKTEYVHDESLGLYEILNLSS